MLNHSHQWWSYYFQRKLSFTYNIKAQWASPQEYSRQRKTVEFANKLVTVCFIFSFSYDTHKNYRELLRGRWRKLPHLGFSLSTVSYFDDTSNTTIFIWTLVATLNSPLHSRFTIAVDPPLITSFGIVTSDHLIGLLVF